MKKTKQIRMIADFGITHECSQWYEKENEEQFAALAVNYLKFRLANPAIKTSFEEREVEPCQVAVVRRVDF